MEHYDIIIIGTGAGGGTMAYALAETGKKILLLERGDFLPRERENWSTEEVFKNKRYQAHETWTYNGEPFRPEIHYWVGGNTKMYGAALFRLREADFGEIKHVGGVSPAWPVGYDVFAPYYTQAEKLYHVHGERGIDPTEPPTDNPYAYPPLTHEPRVSQLKADLEHLGYHPFPLPMGIKRGEGVGDSPVNHSTFDGYPDLTESKADAHVIAVKPALQHDNVALLTNRMVWKLATDASGKTVKGVHVRHNGEEEVYSADIVVVAAGAANSAAIFLRSASDTHPNGLGNSSDMVGRNYICHNNGTFIAISKEPNDSIFQKTLAMSDWYGPSADWDYPMGLIQMLGKVDETLMAFEAPEPLGGMTYAEMAAHSLDFWLQGEDLPDPNNRITVNSEGGIELHYTENNIEAYNYLVGKLRVLLGHIGCYEHLVPVDYYLGTKFPFNLAHQAGTMRFGTDSQTSVLDVNCRVHDLDNVYVTDAAFMPSIGAVNPSLTIIANVLRVADHLKSEVL
ncbi:MAG: GMC family oxidoreductase [Chloroflexota bacterium]